MINAQMVKDLRERTGSGVMECKKALQSANGDIDKAIEILRTQGVAQADKKANRIAAQGRVIISQKDNQFILLEVNCETDFVAKSPDFIAFMDEVASEALASATNNVEALLQENPALDKKRRDLISKIGENITIRRLEKLNQQGRIGYYLHDNTMGAIVDVVCDNKDDAVDLARDLAMHIVAFSPSAIDESGLDSDILASEKRILKKQALQSGKDESIIEKMIVGKVKKFINENTLLGQKFVKDQDISIAQLLKQKKASVVSFARFKVGEGIEKEADDFYSEVMSQVKKD